MIRLHAGTAHPEQAYWQAWGQWLNFPLVRAVQYKISPPEDLPVMKLFVFRCPAVRDDTKWWFLSVQNLSWLLTIESTTVLLLHREWWALFSTLSYFTWCVRCSSTWLPIPPEAPCLPGVVQVQVTLLVPRGRFCLSPHTYIRKNIEAQSHILQLRTVEIRKYQIKKFLKVLKKLSQVLVR